MKRKDAAFVAIPNHDGRVHVSTLFGMLMASGKRPAFPMAYTSSLLPKTFNYLWAKAIQSDCLYWAMMHSDIGPEPHWLDTLINELETYAPNGIMSACVMIRESNAVSCALDTDEGFRRLTVNEVKELPTTFCTGDVRSILDTQGDLVVNTGLWVCRLDSHWVKRVFFELRSIVEWDGGDVNVGVEPEDWLFSRRLHELGVPVYGTRAVGTVHWGLRGYNTPWGAAGW